MKPGTKLKTRGGQDVTIISAEGRGDYPILGYIGESNFLSSWKADGMYCGIIKHRDDIIPLRTDEEDWIPHTTGKIPCDGSEIVDVKFNNGTISSDKIALCLGWSEGSHPYDIAAWRPHKKPDPQPKPEKWAAEKAAFAAGKTIQFSYKEEPWADLDGTPLDYQPTWEDKNLEYRIKPEPQWIPIGPEDVPPGSSVRMMEIEVMVLRSSKSGVYICGQVGNIYEVEYDELFEDWQIKRPGEDWKPCKKEVAV
jgi:hypothetical protein